MKARWFVQVITCLFVILAGDCCLALGDEYSPGAIYYWDGITLTDQTTMLGPSHTEGLRGIAARSADNVYITEGGWGGIPGVAHKWNGASWDVDAAMGSTLLKVGEKSGTGTDMWGVGEDMNSRTSFLRHYDGVEWSTINPAEPAYLGCASVARVSSTEVYVAGTNYQSALVYAFNGTDWACVYEEPSSENYDTLFCSVAVHGSNIYAVGRIEPDVGTWNPLAVQYDGESWSYIPMPSDYTMPDTVSLESVDVSPTGKVWMVARGSRHLFVYDGTSTVALDTGLPDNYGLWSVRAIDDNHVWVVGFRGSHTGNESIAIMWDGMQWNVMYETDKSAWWYEVLWDVDGYDPNHVWIVGNKRIISEPAMLSLLAVGGLALIRRRKSRA